MNNWSERDFETSATERLLAQVGQEEHLAERILAERKSRGWSQEKLARELGKVGCKMPQSAIWKIENPVDGKRRSISVDEAMAFSRVFMLPLATLLLPPDALEQSRLYRDIQGGPEAAFHLIRAFERYEDLLASIKRATVGQPHWRKRFEAALAKAEKALAERSDDAGVTTLEATVHFYRDLLKEAGDE